MIAGISGTMCVMADFGIGERLDLNACELERLLSAEQHRGVVFNQQNLDRI